MRPHLTKRVLKSKSLTRKVIRVESEETQDYVCETLAISQAEVDGVIVDKKREETKHRTEWCAEAHKYQCMRCGRGSKCMKMQGTCTGPKYLSKMGK